MDDQIDPGDNFFGINLSDCVTVAANLPSNAHTEPQDAPKRPFEQVAGIVAGSSSKVECKTEDSAYAQYRLQNHQNFMDGVIRAAAQQQAANSGLGNIPIMDSVVGLKAANAHLTRQLAAQALAHAEQMEGLKASTPKKSDSQLYAEMMGQAVDQCELTNLHRELASARAFIEQLKAAEFSAMRITPTTHPTDAQQTASDVKAAPERRPDGTLKPVAKTWEAPKRLTDVRRLGG